MENNNNKNILHYIWNNLEYLIAGVLMVVMIASLLMQVFFRFVVRHPLGWTEELAVTSFVMMVYVGSIGATHNDDHMKMEVVINLLGEKARYIVLIIGDVVFAVVNIILAKGLLDVAMNLKKYRMTTAMLGIPKWIPYMVLPICFLAMDIRLLQNIKKKIVKIGNNNNKSVKAEESSLSE